MQNDKNINDGQDNVKKYLIKTFGCQMNEHDSEKISWILENMNYTATDDLEEADFIIYNTYTKTSTFTNTFYLILLILI